MTSGLLKRKNIALLSIKNCIYFLENVMKMKLLFISPLLFWCLLDHGKTSMFNIFISVFQLKFAVKTVFSV